MFLNHASLSGAYSSSTWHKKGGRVTFDKTAQKESRRDEKIGESIATDIVSKTQII